MWLRSDPPERCLEPKDTVSSKKRPSLPYILTYLREYCNYSGIHGFRYLSEERRNWFEKLFWATAIAISIFGCAMMISKIKTKMDTTPIIVTLADTPIKVWHVPFPAVTICMDWMARLTVFNFTKYATLMSRNDQFFGDFLNWVKESKIRKGVPDHHTNYTFRVLDNDAGFNGSALFETAEQRNSLYKKLWALHSLRGGLQSVRGYPGNSTLALDEEDLEFLAEVIPSIKSGTDFPKKLRNFMLWRSKLMPLEEHFKHLWAEYGLCFAFNMMDDIHVFRDKVVNNDEFRRKGLDKNFPKPVNDWDPDFGYSRELANYTYPWRVPFEKRMPSKTLRFVTTFDLEDIDKFWSKDTLNYRVVFHHPQDYPQVFSDSFVKVPLNKLLNIGINIDVMTTSPELKKFGPHVRGCYYSYEKQLEYFKFYSHNNCQLECLTNISLKLCGCVAIFMPRYKTTKVCGRDAYNCLMKASLQADKDEVDASLNHLSRSGESPFHSANTEVQCDCLPNCLSITYEAEVRVAEDFKSLRSLQFEDHSAIDSEESLVLSGADIFVKKRSFTANERSEYYGELEFFANCGGLFGLFCGFSILSIIEVIYFLTIRLWANIYERLTSIRPQPRLPTVQLDAEDPPQSLTSHIVPPVDPPMWDLNISPRVYKELSTRAQTKLDKRPALPEVQYYSEEMHRHFFRR